MNALNPTADAKTTIRTTGQQVRPGDFLIVDEDKAHGAVVVDVFERDSLIEVYLHAGPSILLFPEAEVTVRRRSAVTAPAAGV